MAIERSTAEIFAGLYSQAQRLWGEEDAERQRHALQRAAEEIAVVQGWEIPPDLEPRFFAV
jgi:hypothetical protein